MSVLTIPVSVVMPAFNREDTIERAIESVHRQRDFSVTEIIVVDDGSQDGTARRARDAGARVLTNPRNRGVSASRNIGIEAASTPWIAQLDSDDEWLPECLSLLWRSRADHVLVTVASRVQDAEGALIGVAGVPGRAARTMDGPRSLIGPVNYVNTSAVLFRRDVALRVGGYDAGLAFGEDLDLWLRILEHGTGSASPAIGGVYCMHTGQATRDEASIEQSMLAPQSIARRYSARAWWSDGSFDRLVGALAWDQARRAARQGDRRRAAGILRNQGRRPARLVGVLELLIWRRALRRKRRALVGRVGPGT